MIESINDGLSFLILILIPFLAIVFAFKSFLNKRKKRIHKEVGKYYREW